jgi:hypothetical protein
VRPEPAAEKSLPNMNAIALKQTQPDPHEQLRRLYRSLLEEQDRFDEFKFLLSQYPAVLEGDSETEEARAVRAKLNGRITDWLNGDFDGLSTAQVMLWRSIVVEERINVALSPWKESNFY